MKFIPFVILFSLMAITHQDSIADNISAEDLVLHFDDVEKNLQKLHFKDSELIKPGKSVFEIIENYFMSNNLGERWAVITIKNTSSGKRLLRNENIVATYANGKQSTAQNLDESLDGNDVLTKAVLFGVHKFPILTVEAR